MKMEDYKGIIEKIGNPDTIAEGLVDLNSQLQKDFDDYKAVKASNDTLRDTNSKLALRITETVKTDDKDLQEQEQEDVYDTFMNQLTENLKGD